MSTPHILITRPQPEAGLLSQSIETEFQSILMPAFRFRALPEAELPSQFMDSDARKLIAFMSPRAVEFGLPRISPEILAASSVAAIGRSTARQLRLAGVEADVLPPEGHTTEDLLRHEYFGQDPGVAVLVNAPEGRKLFAQTLRSSGWAAFDWHVYERIPAIIDAAAIDEVRAAPRLWTVWTSARAVELISARLPRDAWNRVRAGRWFVPSDRVEKLARRVGVETLTRIEAPSNDNIHAALKEALATEQTGN